jgi:hypothetical protein
MRDLRTPRIAPRMVFLLLAGALGAGCKTDREVITIADAGADAPVGDDGKAPGDDGKAPGDDGRPPGDDGKAPGDDGRPPGEDGKPPGEDGLPGTPDGPRPPFDVLPAAPDTPLPWYPEGGTPPQPDVRYEDTPPAPHTAEGWTQQDLGEVDSNTASQAQEQAATIAVDATGTPVVAFEQAAQIDVLRLIDGAWRRLPGINDLPMRPSYEPQVLLEADGSPTVAWVGRDLQNLRRLRVDTYGRNKWDSVGAVANAEGTAHPNEAFAPRLVQSSAGRVLAWLTPAIGTDRRTLVVTKQEGTAWTDLGPPFSTRPGAVTAGPALVGSESRPPVVAWTETVGGEAVLELRRWNAASSSWDELPAVPGVRSDGPLSLARSSNTLYLAAGTPDVLRLRDGDSAWTPIGRPVGALGLTGVTGLALSATFDDRLALTWTTDAGNIALGQWKAGEWVQVTAAANSLRAGAAPNVAIDPASGRVYVAWQDQSDDRQKVRAAAFSPAP